MPVLTDEELGVRPLTDEALGVRPVPTDEELGVRPLRTDWTNETQRAQAELGPRPVAESLPVVPRGTDPEWMGKPLPGELPPAPEQSLAETTIPGVLGEMGGDEGAFETLMQPVVELPAVPAGLMQGVLSPLLPGETGRKIAEGAGKFASKALSSLTSPGMLSGIGPLAVVAPPVAAAVIGGMGASGVGPASVEAIEASKRGDLAQFTEHTLDAAMAGTMGSIGVRGLAKPTIKAVNARLKPGVTDKAFQPLSSQVIEAMLGERVSQPQPPVLPTEKGAESAKTTAETKVEPTVETASKTTEPLPGDAQGSGRGAAEASEVLLTPEPRVEALQVLSGAAPAELADALRIYGARGAGYLEKAGKTGKDLGMAVRLQMGKKLWEDMTPAERMTEFQEYALADLKRSVPEAQQRPIDFMLDRALDFTDPMAGIYRILLKNRGAQIDGGKIKLTPELKAAHATEMKMFPPGPMPDNPNAAISVTESMRLGAEEKAQREGKSLVAEPVAPAEPEAAGPSRPGPILTPTTAAAIPVTPPKALSQVIRDLSEGLATPIRFGRLIAKKAGGYFLPTQNLIATKFANDIVVTSHEVGHKIDSLLNLRSNPTVATELMFLGDDARPGSMSSWTKSKTIKYRKGEGVAEFMRYWLTDPAEATKLAPQTAALFEATITTLPDVNKMLRQARDDIALWRASEPQARLRSQISVGEQSSTRYDLSDLTRDIVDDLHYLKLATDDVTKLGGAGLAPSKNPYLLARLTRGAYGEADAFIKSGSIDFRTREVSGPGLKQILEPVGPRIADFRDYIVSRQAKEMRTQGKETGLLPGDVDFVVSKFQGDAAFNTAFDGLKQWSDSLVQYAVDSGYLSADSAAAMRKMNQEYVPMHRIFEVGAGELGQQGGASGRGLNAVKSAFKGRRGSRRDIVDPLETYVKNTYAILLNADKNAVNIAIADFAKRPGMGKWVEPIATPKEVQKVGVEKIREELEANGADLTGVPDDLLLTFWKDSTRAPVGENVIKVNRAGKLEFYRLNEDLYRTVQALDSESAGTLLKILSAPAQILRAGATLTPDFAISNAMRDTLTSSIISRYGTFPVEHTLRGLYSLLKNPKTVAEFRASGGAQSIEAHYFDRAALQNFLKENVSKDFSYADYAKFVAKSPLTALRLLSGTFEEATRIGEYQRVFDNLVKDGYNAGEARRLAAFEARDLQDFAMGGAKTKGLRRVTAFWNAALQGNYRLYQSLKDPETRMATMAKATAFVTIPTLTLFAINKDDPDYWDKPQWARDLFWLIPRGKDDLGHTKFLHIPKPFGIGLMFGTVPERALQSWFKEDPDAFKDLPKQVANATIPNPIPQPITTLFGAFLSGDKGYDLFRGRSIVPESMEDFPAELQFTEQTSLTAKRVGKAIGLSPMKVDFLINQTGGGLARQGVNQGVDRVLSWVTGDERTARSTYPGARFAGLPSGVQSAAVEKFYERLKELRQEGKRRDITGQGEDRFLGMAENTARRLSLLRKQQLRTKDETERQKISLEMREAAERTLQLMKERAAAP